MHSNQARRQDLAAGGPNTRCRGKEPEGGHILKIQYWMYAATGGPNVKWGGTDFKWGSRAPLPPPLATALIPIYQMIEHIRLFLTANQLIELSQRDVVRHKQLFT